MLESGADIAGGIAFSNTAPAEGDLHLQNIEIIQIGGGTRVGGDVDASAADALVNFVLLFGTIGGNVIGSPFNDGFSLYSAINIGGYLDGGGGHRYAVL